MRTPRRTRCARRASTWTMSPTATVSASAPCASRASVSSTMFGSKIVFIFTGSIACYKACDAVSKLVQRGHTVRTVATGAALRFVGRATLEGLTRTPVATDLFEEGAALDHINLTRWADAVVV